MWHVLKAFVGYPAGDEKAYQPGDIITADEAEAMGLADKPDLAEVVLDPENP